MEPSKLAEHLVAEGIDSPDWYASRQFAEMHNGELSSEASERLLAALGAQNPGHLAIRLHRGLLAVARSDGIDAAYTLQADRTALLAELSGAAGNRSRLLTLARLDSGSSPGDAEGYFRLAEAALAAGELDEATVAIAQCAEHALQFERRHYARRLDAVAAERADLSLVVTELKRRLQSEATT